MPHLIAAPVAPGQEASESANEPAAGNDEVTDAERGAVDRWHAAVRSEAELSAGLTQEEAALVHAIRQPLDARRSEFERQVDPTTGMLEPLATAAILGNRRAELRQLERALGRERARVLREAELAAHRRLLAGSGLDLDRGFVERPVIRRMLLRRGLSRAARVGPVSEIAPDRRR